MTDKSKSKSKAFLGSATEGSTARTEARASNRIQGKAKRARVKCEHCHGRGYYTVGEGLAALQDKYPELPMREIQNRGWLGFPDEDDARACDAAFLAFWRVASHEELYDEFPYRHRDTGSRK